MFDQQGCCCHLRCRRLVPTARWECLPGTFCGDPLDGMVGASVVIVLAVLLVAVWLVAMGHATLAVVAIVSAIGTVASQVFGHLAAAAAAVSVR